MDEIFQVEYNEADKINVMIKYSAEMIAARRMFHGTDEEKVYNDLLHNLNGNQTYYSDDQYNIDLYISLDKLKKIDKSGDLALFLETNPDNYKIVIVNKSIPKITALFDSRQTWELVYNKEMMSSRRDHISNPTFRQLSEEEQDAVREEYNLINTNLASLPKLDSMRRYLRLQPGEIVEIDRSSISAGSGIMYRIVT
jgi:DNA-directed RNA polymerase subunit H (RpoH/RPB5)